MGDSRYEVEYNGHFYDDFDWTKKIHQFPDPWCDICGGDSAEGHQSACYYQFHMQQSPRGREFLRNELRKAFEREEQEKIRCQQTTTPI